MPPIHPAATLFPMLPEPQLRELADDIKANGQRDPVILWHGQLLDGRNRWMACDRAGVEPRTARRDDITDPVAFVISVNIHRRHLDESQRAMAAARARVLLAEPPEPPPQLEIEAANLPAAAQPRRPALTYSDVTSMLHVSERSARSAKLVLATGIPELAQRVDAGQTAVSTAAEVAQLPAGRQAEIVARGEKEIIETAKRLRKEKNAQRKPRDAYHSAGGFVRPLLPVLGADVLSILECCAGAGDLVAPLREAGHAVITADIDPAASVDHHLDMRAAESWAKMPPVDWVVSNLPFNVAIEILPHAVQHAARGVAVILRLTFLEPVKERAAWLAEHPLTGQIVLPRYSFTGDGNVDSVTCSWMIWEKGKPPAIFIPVPDEQGMPGDLPALPAVMTQQPLPAPPAVAADGGPASDADEGDGEAEWSDEAGLEGDACLDCKAEPGEPHAESCDDFPLIVPLGGGAPGHRMACWARGKDPLETADGLTARGASLVADRWQAMKGVTRIEIANPDGAVIERREKVGKAWSVRTEEPQEAPAPAGGPMVCRTPSLAEQEQMARDFPEFVKPLGPPPINHPARASKRVGALIKHAEGAIAARNFDSAQEAIDEAAPLRLPSVDPADVADAVAKLRALLAWAKAQPGADDEPPPPKGSSAPKAKRVPREPHVNPIDMEGMEDAATVAKLIKAIETSYSGDKACNDEIRKPVEIDAALWVNLGGSSKGASHRVTLWRVVPIEEWSGLKETYTSEELVARYEAGDTWRGDHAGHQVKQGARFFVMTGQRRVYRWGPEQL